MICRSTKSAIRNFWSWFYRQWSKAEEIQRRIDAERLKAQERYGSDFPSRWI